MDIFESLENLPVSEGCFEDIISIVETLVGRFAEKGAPVTGNEEEFKKEMTPLVRTKKKLTQRKLQAGVDAAEKLAGDIKGAEEETVKAKQKYDDYSKKEQEAYKNYKDAKEGTELQSKLFDKWGKLFDKNVKAGQKHSDASDKEEALKDSRNEVHANVSKNEKKYNELGDLLAKVKREDLNHLLHTLSNRGQASEKALNVLYPKK